MLNNLYLDLVGRWFDNAGNGSGEAFAGDPVAAGYYRRLQGNLDEALPIARELVGSRESYDRQLNDFYQYALRRAAEPTAQEGYFETLPRRPAVRRNRRRTLLVRRILRATRRTRLIRTPRSLLSLDRGR